MVMRTHRVEERFVRSTGSATGTASACRRSGRLWCRMMATAACASTTDRRLRLRNSSLEQGEAQCEHSCVSVGGCESIRRGRAS